MKFLKIALLFVAVASSAIVSAREGVVNTQFQGWLGKNQHGYIMDHSDWHYCWSDTGGSCGSKSLTTGHSTCHSHGFDIGASWSPPQIGGMGISGSYSRSWTACNNRSETITCSPNKGYRGRAA